MRDRGLAELVEWAGVRPPPDRPRPRFVAAAALDDFPGAASARALLHEAPRDVLHGAALLAKITSSRPIVVVGEGERTALEVRGGAATHVQVVEAPGMHPLSSPGVLATWLSKQPRLRGARPEEFAVVPAEEAATLAAGERGRPRLEHWITVTGAVRRPGTFRVPHGTTVATLLRLADGRSDERARPWMAGQGALRPVGTARGTRRGDAALVALPDDVPLGRNATLPVTTALRRIDSVCTRCFRCDDVCPVAQPDARGRSVGPMALLDALRFEDESRDPGAVVWTCVECAVCETVCPSALPVARIAAEVAARLRSRGGRRSEPAGDGALVPREAMRRRLRLGPDPAPRQDAVASVRRVRLSLQGGATLCNRGEPVWRGETIARDSHTGRRILASISGVLSRSGDAVTIRRVREEG